MTSYGRYRATFMTNISGEGGFAGKAEPLYDPYELIGTRGRDALTWG